MKTIILLLMLLFCFNAKSQNGLTEYFDSEQEIGKVNSAIKYQNKIIYVGASFESSLKPAMICLDTNGVVIWNTVLTDVTTYNSTITANQQYKLILGSDGYIYSTGMKDGIIEYWKVDPANGQFIWKKTITNATKQAEILMDYDSTQFLLCYISNVVSYTKNLCLVNKSNGSFNTSKFLGNYNSGQTGSLSVTTDNDNNIYYSFFDSIKKLDATNLNNVLWKAKYTSVGISSFTNLHFNPADSMLVAFAVKSSNEQFHILKVNSSNGTLLSTLPLTISQHNVSQLTVRNNYLYASFQHKTTGSGTTRFSLLKYNLSTYTVSWLVQNNFNSNNQAILSFDFDDTDNIFCTGYYASANFGPGKWGILKLSSTGTALYSQTINRVSASVSAYSQGNVAVVIDNKPCFLGLLDGEFSVALSNVFFARLNNQSGNIERKVSVGGKTVKSDSKVVDIIEYQNNKKLVLIKRGRIGQLICYDAANTELWRTTLENQAGHYTVPYNVAATADGNIWVSGLLFYGSNSSPYVSTVTYDLLVYKISSSGAILNLSDEYSSSANYLPQEFMIQGNYSNLLYRSNSYVRLKNYAAAGQTEFNLNYSILSKLNNNFFVPVTSTLGYISGNIPTVTPYINGYTSGVGQVSSKGLNYGLDYAINCSAGLDANNIIIGGQTGSAKAMVLRFNRTINDTLWRYQETASGSESIVKVVVADNKSSCYLLSNSLTSSDIVIRKIKTSNGSLIWKKTYNGALNSFDEGVDIAFDSLRKQIVVVGYETYSNTSNRVPLILKLDTLGTFQDTVKVLNSQTYFNGSFDKVKVFSNGQVLVGGKYYSPGVQQCGIINITNNPIQHVYENANSCSSYNWSRNGLTYTTSGNYTYYSLTIQDTVYHLNLNINSISNTTISVNSCIPYTWLINNNTYALSGQYVDTLLGSSGCDSIITLNLTILNSNTGVDIQTVCDSLTWIDGNTYYSSTNTSTFVLQNAAGCDSTVTLNLTITHSNTGTDNQTVCDSLIWIDGHTYYSSTNTPTFTLQNATGCDSIVTLNLTITNSTNGTDVQTACDSLTWIDGHTYYSSTNTPTFVLQNAAGCDSVVTLNLTITNSTSGTNVQTACDSLTWIDGNTYTSSTNIPTFILQNAIGCDSTVTLNLTIIPSLPLLVENVFVFPSDANSCTGEAAIDISGSADFELDFDNGSQLVTSSGYSLVSNLCAGVHDLHVTDNCGDTLSIPVVIPVDSNFVFNNPFIDSLAQDSLGVTMTNCDIYYAGIDTAYIDSIWATGNTVNVIWNIVDSNGSNFDTTNYVLNNGNGVYWLQLSVFCPNKSLGEYFTVTEAIYFNNGSVSTAGLTDIGKDLFEIYPNPTNDQVHISFSGSDAELTVYDLQGKTVLKDRIQNNGMVSLQNFERGVYLFDFRNSQGHSVQRVVKQ